MSKKLLLLIGLIVLLTSSIWAQTNINLLTTHINSNLQTTLTVAPTLTWTHGGASNAYYKVFISTNPSLSGATEITVTAPALAVNLQTVPQILAYNTTYYWQVRQYNIANVELLNRSAIASFRTPKVSVVPYLTWPAIAEAGNYFVSLDNGVTWTDTESTNLYYKVPTSTPLNYNTVYNWKVKKGVGGTPSATYTFTTKPLTIISETYNRAPYSSVEIGNTLTYTAITDEFEDLSTAVTSNISFTALSSIAHPTRPAFPMAFSAPVNNAGVITSTVTRNFTFIAAGPAVNPSNSEIKITNNEFVNLNFQYGSPFVLTTFASSVTLTGLNTFTDAYVTALATNHTSAANLYFQFTTGGAQTVGITKKIIIKNLNNLQSFTKQAYVIAGSANEYRMQLTAADINAITDINAPARISVYSQDQPSIKRDFIWLGDGIMPAAATTANFSAPSYNPTQLVTIIPTGSNWVRIYSNTDPVGFVTNTNLNDIEIGIATNSATNTIEGAIGGTITAARFDGTFLNSANIVAQTYTAFQMLTPANFSTAVDIYPRLSWTSAFSAERGTTDRTYYQVTISTSPTFAPGPNTVTYTTTNTEFYPEVDLTFGTSYFWKVNVLPGGANSVPTNITENNAWVFTTTPATGYTITSTIPSNRTLTATNSTALSGYKFAMSPGTANNTTLTIEPGVSLKFAAGTKFVIGGNIIANGTLANPITFTTSAVTGVAPYTAALWQGIEFKHDVAISRTPLVVNENMEYVSGNYLDYVNIEYSTKPISYQTSAAFDIYISNSTFTHNENGIDISPNSYLNTVALNTFDAIGTTPQTDANKYGIRGGYLFNSITITGVDIDTKFGGLGIQTSNKNAIINGASITFIKGNAIDLTSSATDGQPVISGSTIRGTGTNATNYAIKAIQGAKITNNTIGGAADGQANTGFAISKGAFIASNTITRNGAGAILADAGATVINNIITDNAGYGIQNGLVITGNQVVNTDGVVTPELAALRNMNAIKADDQATVSNNVITNNKGFGISGGKIITNNTIQILAPSPAITGSVAANYAITAKTGLSDSRVENNIISNPVGFAINGGKIINNNTINGGNLTLDTAYGILAEVGSTINNNVINSMKGTNIERGILIHNNTITLGKDGIKADVNAVITNNTLTNNPDNVNGFAISGGEVINFNTVKGYHVAGSSDIISSVNLKEFRSNIIGSAVSTEENKATGGSILNAVKTLTTPLVFTDNQFINNKYKNNHIRVSSNELTFNDNLIDNNYDPTDETTIQATGGLIFPYNTVAGTGTAMYIKLKDNLAVMKRNTIKDHKGFSLGAALYIEATAALTDKIVIDDENNITNNHIVDLTGKGAAVYHVSGQVILGSTNPAIKGNTITYNSVPDTNRAPSGSAIFTVPNGLATPATNGYMDIYRNIIASNAGNYAIYGAPRTVMYNNIYDNTYDGNDEEWITPPLNQGRNFYYTQSVNHSNAISNFWGSRSDMGQIDPSIYDDNESSSLGIVTYQPLLSGPSSTTPGIVSNVVEVKAILDLADINTNGIVNLPTDDFLYVAVSASDNNDYSADFTEVRITNQTTGFFIQPLLQETGAATEKYVAQFKLATDGTYNPELNILPVTGGDIIRISSVANSSVTISLMAALEGATSITPYITQYNFGPWDVSLNNNVGLEWPAKKFTFTNSGNADLTLVSIDISSLVLADAAAFSLLPGYPADGTTVPAGASFDVIVRFQPNAGTDVTIDNDANDTFLDVIFNTGIADINTRRIRLAGESIPAWTNNYLTEPWGTPSALTNQMTIIADVTVDGADPAIGDILGAFVIKGMKEELRGKAQILNDTGLSTIVVQTEIADEEVYFKLWDVNAHRLYETPNVAIINSIPGGSVGLTRDPVEIPAKSVINLSGNVNDGANPLQEVIVLNIHSDAEVNPATNRPFEYTTDVNGDYFMQIWNDSPVILNAQRSGYSFVTVDAAPYNAANAGGLIISTVDLDYGTPVVTYDAETIYYNDEYAGAVDEAAIDLITPTLTVTPQINLDFTGTIETFVVAGKIVLGDGTVPLTNLVVYNGVRTNENGEFFFIVDSGTTVQLNITRTALDAAGYTDIAPFTYDVNSGNPITANNTATNINDNTPGISRTQEITLIPGWNLISFNVVPANTTPASVFAAANITPSAAHITQVRTMSEVWDSSSPETSTLSNIESGQAYYVWNNHNASIVLSLTGDVAKVENISLLTGNWNLVGYTPEFLGQTRIMVQNDDDILQINTLRDAYFYTDLPVGASTLNALKPGKGYWMKTDTDPVLPTTDLSYNPDFDNVIKSFEFRTLTNQAYAKGVIEDDYLGLAMTTSTLTAQQILGGRTYTIVSTSDGDIDNAVDMVNDQYYEIINVHNGVPADATTMQNTYYYEIISTNDGVAINANTMVNTELYEIVTTHDGVALAADQTVIGQYFEIVTLGDTDWNAIGGGGAANVGDVFQATGVGAGTGTVYSYTNYQADHGAANNNPGTVFTYGGGAVTGTGTVYSHTNFIAYNAANNNPGTVFMNVGGPATGSGSVYSVTNYIPYGAANNTPGTMFTKVGGVVTGTGTVYHDPTNFVTLFGAANNTPGTVFTASTNGTLTSGTGSVSFMNNALTNISSSALVIGETYKIASVGTTDWVACGASSGLLGEVFTATATAGGNGTANHINAPKRINITVSESQAVANLTATLIENTPFTPVLRKFFTTAQYEALINALSTQGYDAFLDLVRAGTDLGPNLNYTGTTYIIFSSQSLTNTANKQHAQVVVYQVTTTVSTDNTAKTLNAIALEIGGVVYPAVQSGTDFYLLIPNGVDPNGAILQFSINGQGLYTVPTGVGARLISGTTIYTNTGTNLPLNLYVEDNEGANNGTELDRTAYRFFVTVVPADFRSIDRSSVFASAKSSSRSVDRDQDPFGQVNYLPNSHYVLAKITANGAPVSPDYIVAAYVGNQLRGKQQVVVYNGMTYMPILVSTIVPNETITFKLWKEGSEIVTFNNTLSSIPGGRTGTPNNYYGMNITAVGTEEPVVTPAKTSFHSIYPNPFNPSTTVEFSISQNQEVNISVFNIKGQKVKTLSKGMMEKGLHRIVWDGRNDTGHSVSSGIYFFMMDTQGYQKVKKAILLK